VLRGEGLGGLRVTGALGVCGVHVNILGSGVCRRWVIVVCPSVLVRVSYCLSDRHRGVVRYANGEVGVGRGKAVWVPRLAVVVRASYAPFPGYDFRVARGARGIVVPVLCWLHGGVLFVGKCDGTPSPFLCDHG